MLESTENVVVDTVLELFRGRSDEGSEGAAQIGHGWIRTGLDVGAAGNGGGDGGGRDVDTARVGVALPGDDGR